MYVDVRDHLLGKWPEITEWVFGSSVTMMARYPGSGYAKAASESHLYACVVFGWLCISYQMQSASTNTTLTCRLGKSCYVYRKSNTAALAGASRSEPGCEDFHSAFSCPTLQDLRKNRSSAGGLTSSELATLSMDETVHSSELLLMTNN